MDLRGLLQWIKGVRYYGIESQRHCLEPALSHLLTDLRLAQDIHGGLHDLKVLAAALEDDLGATPGPSFPQLSCWIELQPAERRMAG
ncbi:hypothetical protein KBY93_14605 [Synechococcus sp. J7-Johnson]|uniref:hypothetical protein n=1 Tax=Synechococcus sp. J7-Johnson TaxID=2823737 RepID=UPI0020CE80B3|nr:hypothetical protein [Synechococcus sp. J7-Johnson]MCP9841852.1 hypothetical protein [Synechococcus sp. J7-Johnson]